MTKEEFFNENIAIAYKVANKYKINYFNEIEDITQIALLGLWKAVQTYNESYAFTTYAYAVIRNCINMYLRKLKHTYTDISLDTIIHDELTLEDVMEDEHNNIEYLISDMAVDGVIDNSKLTNREKEFVKLRLKNMNQTDIR